MRYTETATSGPQQKLPRHRQSGERWLVADVAFWLDKAYAHLDSGLFDEADIAEFEELAAAYYDRLDAAVL